LLMQHFLEDLIMLSGMTFHAATPTVRLLKELCARGGWRKGAD
jgi:hypothetical protein